MTQCTVLIIDDSAEDRETYRRYLLQDFNYTYTILEEEYGEKGLELCRQVLPDVILLDFLLPDIDGLEFLSELKTQLGATNLPVVMLTGHGDEAIAVAAMKSGVQDYLIKGKTTSESLRLAIHSVVERTRLQSLVEQGEKRFHTSVETMLDCFGIYTSVRDESGQIIDFMVEYVNAAACANKGMSQAEQIGKRLLELLPSSWEVGLFDEYCGVVETDEPLFKEVLVYADVNNCQSLTKAFDIRAAKLGDGFVAVWRDTTERKRTEEALRERTKQTLLRISKAVESTSDAIDIADMASQSIYHNLAFIELYGYTVDELNRAGGPPALFTLPEIAQQVLQAILNGHSWSGEVEMKTKRGQIVPTLLRADCIMDDFGNHIGLVYVCTDITDRKQTQQKLREQAALLDVATDAIFVRDLEHQILFWNKGAEHLYGWQAAEACGKYANELLYNKVLPQFETPLKTVIEQGEWQGELSKVTKDGKKVIVASRWALVRNEAGQPKSILTVDTDITQKKQLEAQFLRTQRLESLGTLAGGIAHDLNNILTPILAIAQLLPLKLRNIDAQSQQLLQTLEVSAKRGAAVVKQVLSFTRGVEGKRTVIQIRCLIGEVKQVAQQTFPKTIQVYADLAPDLWPVFADATHIHQVLMNLSINARDAMPEGGTLSFYAENLFIDAQYAQMYLDAQVGPYIVITVADTGTGMPPEVVDQIFDPFFTTKEPGKGTGLGLSTVIGIIKSYGGFVKVLSQVGVGTEFKIFLPAMKGTQTPIVEESKLPIGRGEVILVVDDEAQIREIIQTTLETYNYKVLKASDGIEAIALYVQHKDEVSVVLLDMMMPSMDGATTIGMLRKINPIVKVVATSGLVPKNQLMEALGVQSFLPKPYTTQELLNTLHGVLST